MPELLVKIYDNYAKMYQYNFKIQGYFDILKAKSPYNPYIEDEETVAEVLKIFQEAFDNYFMARKRIDCYKNAQFCQDYYIYSQGYEDESNQDCSSSGTPVRALDVILLILIFTVSLALIATCFWVTGHKNCGFAPKPSKKGKILPQKLLYFAWPSTNAKVGL